MEVKNLALYQPTGIFSSSIHSVNHFIIIRSLCVFTDPFASSSSESTTAKIHIRIQQRSGKTSITTVEGLPTDLDLTNIARALKRTFHCNSSVTTDPERGEIIQLSGDQRINTRDFFVREEVCLEDQIIIHGA